jgi:hypothetical protein
MRFARKLMLLVVAAAAVMALAAPSASATTAISVTDAGGKACPALPTGCKVHSEGEITLYFHIFGIESTEATCHVEHRGAVSSTGAGQITAQTITPGKHDADCKDATSPPCTGSLPWKGNAEKDADGVVRPHYTVCTAPGERPGETCSGEFITNLSESGGAGAEVQIQGAKDLRIGTSSFCELDVDSRSEAGTPEGQFTHIKGN